MLEKENVSYRTFKKTAHAKSADDGQGWTETEVNDTLNIFDNGEARTPTLILENHPNDSRIKIREDGKVQTLSSRMGTGGYGLCKISRYSHADSVARVADVVPCMQGRQVHGGNNVQVNSIVRRLTPLECERLQGYPDGWTDIGEWTDSKGKKHKDSDSPRYKALGNSIALPFWEWMADRMVKQLKTDGIENPTMASLFDGIGGFPLVYSRCGCKPVWASEIEEFPIAVTKIRFPERTEDNERI